MAENGLQSVQHIFDQNSNRISPNGESFYSCGSPPGPSYHLSLHLLAAASLYKDLYMYVQ